jgi:hypothetical protein
MWKLSGRRCDVAVAVLCSRSPRPAARPSRLFLFRRFYALLVAADRGREDVDRNGFAAAVDARIALLLVGGIGLLICVRLARAAFTTAAVEAFVAVAAFFALVAVIRTALLFPGLDEFVVTVVVVVNIFAALTPLILEACAALAQHAEIMVCELQIIFGLDAVAGKLGIARHVLVLLEQLRSIAALTIVLAVPRLSAEVLASLSPATAPAATTLSIVDQIPTSLRSGS